MKKFSTKIKALALCVLLFAAAFSQAVAGVQYNDAKYANYVNMNGENESGRIYIVPNLYRQDASYKNVKSFPLVVMNSVEYVPLEIFAMYSYIEVVYSKLSFGFYINNTNTNKYIAFNLEDGTTTTSADQAVDASVQMCYRTYYVPAKIVCDAVGLNFESYDNASDGIHAARVSDSSAKYTLAELVDMYSPKKNDTTRGGQTDEPDTGGSTQPDVGQGGQITPAPDDKYKNVLSRNVYLSFDNCPDEYTGNILDILRAYNCGATFFMTAEKILERPETVRRILVEGHNIGIYCPTDGASGEEYSASGETERILSETKEANEALKLITKKKARYVRIKGAHEKELKENGMEKALKDEGLVIYGYTFDTRNYGRAQGVYDALVREIAEKNTNRAATHYINFSSGAYSAPALSRFLEFCGKYTQFRTVKPDEYTVLPAL
ncbi:MAG: polysaccharide deacetylase family protein [Clostridiales bacterium]|nr:polysaccharide deacetylase family protein [Clostridiales bacterium]